MFARYNASLATLPSASLLQFYATARRQLYRTKIFGRKQEHLALEDGCFQRMLHRWFTTLAITTTQPHSSSWTR